MYSWRGIIHNLGPYIAEEDTSFNYGAIRTRVEDMPSSRIRAMLGDEWRGAIVIYTNKRLWNRAEELSQPMLDAIAFLIDVGFSELKHRDDSLTVILQRETYYVLKYGFDWSHFTDTKGLHGLMSHYIREGKHDIANQIRDKICSGTPKMIKDAIKSYPELTKYAEEYDWHDKVEAIKIVSVFFRYTEVRDYLTKEYYEVLRAGIFMDKLSHNYNRKFSELKFFDKQFGIN